MGNRPRLVTSGIEIRRAVQSAHAAGKKVGLVPTMGALHEGHLSLVDASRAQCDVTVVTIFVNPAQFEPTEDFEEYPHSMEADLAALAARGVDLVFAPTREEIYPPGHSTYIEPPQAAEPLEGACRPGHFRGVTTVVLKLFNLVPADFAFFGQKDYQQSVVIRRMVEDLNVPIRIRVCPTVREPDGLALSSRNRYLNPEQRKRALSLSRSLKLAAKLVEHGEQDAAAILDAMRNVMTDAGVDEIDYVALVDPETLASLPAPRRPAVALVAARVGQTRLIDNWQIE